MTKTNLIAMTSFLTLALSLAACGKDGGGGSGGKLGVAECDAYFEKMDACAKKKGGPTGTQLSKMSKMMRDAWSKEVKNPDMKESMPGVCSGAIEDMKKQVPDCDW